MSLQPINKIITGNFTIPKFKIFDFINWTLHIDSEKFTLHGEGFITEVKYFKDESEIKKYCQRGHSYLTDLVENCYWYLIYVPTSKNYVWIPELDVSPTFRTEADIPNFDGNLPKNNIFDIADKVEWHSSQPARFPTYMNLDEEIEVYTGIGIVTEKIWVQDKTSLNFIRQTYPVYGRENIDIDAAIDKGYQGWAYLLYMEDSRLSKGSYLFWLPEYCLTKYHNPKNIVWQLNLPENVQYQVVDLSLPLSLRDRVIFNQFWTSYRTEPTDEKLREETY